MQLSPRSYRNISRRQVTIQSARQKRPASDILEFKTVDPRAFPVLRHYLGMSGSRSCDYTLGGIAMWTGYFDYEYCVVHDTLFIKGLSEDGSGLTAFAIPCGAMPLRESVALLKDYCRHRGIPLIFSAVPRDRLDDMMELSPRDLWVLPIWSDYIYSIEALATLTGKAYNKKRNHVNRFIADNPGWRLDPIDSTNAAEAIELMNHLHNTAEKECQEMADYELDHSRRVLEAWDDFGFVGGILRDESGRAVAFTAGEIVGDTLVLHIEKADHEVAGAGEMINKAFAEYMHGLHPSLRFINREDDSGDPGLRYAKMSYHPAFLLEKFNLRY
ncbi:MAG: phosphatidylglycerol lysyltransferase domain-containing protein [Muribaculaceae bacterium]|nr:phosphatidylglycerol lysyltransferase domain-containing protein [Muribaculaceae bacterium]